MIAESKVQYTSNNALVGGDWNMVQDEWKYRYIQDEWKYIYTYIWPRWENYLSDVWRYLNPEVKCFTWFKPNGESKSRMVSSGWLVITF